MYDTMFFSGTALYSGKGFYWSYDKEAGNG
jgi:hypothetical protein